TDAKALAQWLVNVQGGKWLPSDVQLVLGAQATRELAESLIRQLCLNEAGPDDLVLIYFAGHAFVDESSGDGYLALANTHYRQQNTALHLFSLVRNAIVSSRAAQIVLILDCFQTGTAWDIRRTSPFDFKPLIGPTLLNGLQQTQGRMLYCSCRGNEAIPEAGGKNLGLFLHSIIIGASGPAIDPATGQVTLQRLHTFLSSSLGPQYQPQVFGQEQRPIVLVGDLPVPALDRQNSYNSTTAPPVNPMGAAPQQASNSPLERFPQSMRATATATAQMSPTTSGELALAVLERNKQQQCMTLVNQARQFVQMQNLTEALNVLENVLQIAPTYIDALILKGQILGTSGRFQEALVAIQRVVQVDPNNALGWSMQAALLANLGQFQDALSAVDRSLALDPNNPETRVVKETILTRQQLVEHSQKLHTAASAKKQDGPLSFFLGACLQIFALSIGAAGASLLLIKPQLPIIIGFVLASVGLSLLCVNAARGSYLYGFSRLLLTFIVSLIAVGIVGALYKLGYNWIANKVITNPPLIVSVVFLGMWLLAATIVPLLVAIGGFISGLVVGVRRK
ncbi:MAG TPA: tetratricopeptide repeat protein, partial [Ktedonobacteraceae bacterium]